MSYGNKHHISYKNNYGTQMNLYVKEEDYAGSSTLRKGTADDPVIINKEGTLLDKFQPIHGTHTSVKLMSESNRAYVELFSATDKKYKIEVWEYSVNRFAGYLFMNSYTELHNGSPYPTEIEGVDYIAVLKKKLFMDVGIYTGEKTLLEILTICLGKTGLDLDIYVGINLFEENHSTGSGATPLEQTYVNCEVFLKDDGTAMDCNTVIENIMRPFGATIFQCNGAWHIIRVKEQGGTYNRSRFNSSGVLQDYVTGFDPTIELTGNGGVIANRVDWINADCELMIYPPTNGVTLQLSMSRRPSIFDYSFFKSDDWYNPASWAITGWTYVLNTYGTTIEPDNETGYNKSGILYWPVLLNSASAGGMAAGGYLQSDNIQIYYANSSYIKLRLTIQYRCKYDDYTIDFTGITPKIPVRIKYTKDVSGSVYYLNSDGSWQLSEYLIYIQNVTPSLDFSTISWDVAIPSDGVLQIRLGQQTERYGALPIPDSLNAVYKSMTLQWVKLQEGVFDLLPDSITTLQGVVSNNIYNHPEVSLRLFDAPITSEPSYDEIYGNSYWGTLFWKDGSDYVPTKNWKEVSESSYQRIQDRLLRDIVNQYQYATTILSGTIKGDGISFNSIIIEPKYDSKWYMINRAAYNTKFDEWFVELVEIRRISYEYLDDELGEHILDENGDPIAVFY